MRKVPILIGLCALVASALTIRGQQAPQDLSPIMKGISHEAQELNKAMGFTGVPIVVQEAEKFRIPKIR